ncbi:alpha/beta hydrolase [Nocardioides sp. HDW12B]|uniref:alpha/beta fold hydrolase n=1 Tax=Nocardioides sp. HDW12B TaxID=2714939 RepID=UPI00140C236E|nr:alpha/beta hydrolase [Nocardioides sp. HDW12B]QIK67495.1 alpha/beta hydrolase [Nocardioides sp. HDW12B]
MSSDAREAAPSPAVTTSEEQVATIAEGVEICFQTFGDPTGDPLLLVMGLGGPLTWWPAALCEKLAAAGFFVIRYDNRDTGRSTIFRDGRVTRQHLVAAFLGRRVPVPYSLRDLAQDGLALLDHLDLPAAHVAGVSMGGMIAQSMAIEAPDRVLSLTSLSSTTGNRRVGFQDPRLLPHLLRRAGRTRDEYVAGSVAFWRRISSPGYRDADAEARERAEVTYDRGISLSGVMRHMIAVLTQRDRTEALRSLQVPTAVIHGLADRMVHVSGGRATAKAVPDADLVLVPGMGHDLPAGLHDVFVETIRRTADRVR